MPSPRSTPKATKKTNQEPSPVTTISTEEYNLIVRPEKKEEPAAPKRRTRNYLNNPDILAEVVTSKANGKMTDKLAHMLMLLCLRYATKPGYAGYTYNDDMQGYALMMLCRTWHKFDPLKSDNPFAFYTQCIKHSFIQYLNQEKRQRDIRDELLIDGGMNPSFSYQLNHSGYGDSDYEGGSSDDLYTADPVAPSFKDSDQFGIDGATVEPDDITPDD